MASNDPEEQLKKLDKETIIRLFLTQKQYLLGSKKAQTPPMKVSNRFMA